MSIIGSLPYNLTNGQTADATQVMADFNAIVNAVNNTSTGAASIPGVQSSSYNYAADTGTVNNIIVGMTPSPASYADGTQGNFKAANTNTSTTVNIKYGSLGNKSLVIDQAGTLPPVGAIIAGMHYRTEYDSTQDKVILINPSRATNSFTLTFSTTYFTVQQTGTINISVEPSGKTVYVRNTSNITGTSNSTSLVGTGVPSWIAPVTSTSGAHRPLYLGEDNSAAFINAMDVGQATAGSWVFFGNTTLLTGGFTGSGAKGFKQCELSFGLD